MNDGQYVPMNTFAALAEPNRRLILDLLNAAPRTVGMLVEAIGLSQPAVSKHLRILRESGLVGVRPEGKLRWYEIEPGPLAELDEWLEPYRKAWAHRLDLLERHLAESAERRQSAEGEPNHDDQD
jgi:DNA-binding transcriptional ArsR family regulator